MARKYTHEEAVAMVLARCNVTITSQYPGSRNPWQMKCNDCTKQISPQLNSIMKGHGACKYCAGKARYTHEEAVAMVLARCNVTITSQYPGCIKPWPMTCNDCTKQISPRLTDILQGQGACRYCAAKGGTNFTTLGRDPVWRWSPSHLYVRRFLDGDHTLYKVGIGTKDRSQRGRGQVIHLIPAPRAMAFVYEQRILKHADRVRPTQALRGDGNTEVVSDIETVNALVADLVDAVAGIATDDDRRAFDAEHFPGCVPIGGALVPSTGQLELFAA